MISAEPLPDGGQLARLGNGGIGTLRVNLAWGSVQGGPDAAYDWSHYDPVIRGAAENGVQVLATVYSTPSWAAVTAEIPPLGSDLKGFDDFARAAVQRYGADGTFWKEHPEVPKLPVAEWQLWNEPNSQLFWKPRPDPSQYLQLLRSFSSTVKGVDPQARIVLGGLFPTPPRRNLTRSIPLHPLRRRGTGPVRRSRHPPLRPHPS